MNYRINILSPVHVSTGNLNPCYLYHYDDGFMDCYRIEDLFKQMTPEQLLELNFKSNKDKAKRYISNYFKRNIDYRKVTPQYYLESLYDDFGEDVKEQMKTLNNPFIPGSSLKGAFMNAIIYDILQSREDDVKKCLSEMSSPNSKKFERELMKKLFDFNFENNFKKFSSCFIFHDLMFENMILCKQLRLNMKNKNTSFNCLECIDNQQEIEDEFLLVDEHRKKIFLSELNEIYDPRARRAYAILEKYLNVDELFKVANNYLKSLQVDDLQYFSNLDHECSDDIVEFLNSLDVSDRSCIIRIGNSTNYFYKSVSLFIKNYFNQYYTDHFSVFTPARLGKKNSPKPDKMPKTRFVLSMNQYFYLAGFIEIERCD